MPMAAEDIAVERAKAKEQLAEMLNTSRPKNLGEGVSSGVNNVIRGAIGSAGVSILAPKLGLAVGLKKGGILGGVVGLAAGTVVGTIGGQRKMMMGFASGVAQVARGIASVPRSITAPRQGKWWNDRLGQWILTDMQVEKEWIQTFPNEDDNDILGPVQTELDNAVNKVDGTSGVATEDTVYYECLEVPADADPATIKRQYYLLSNKYHPDKHPKDSEAVKTFKEIGHAFQVLCNADVRKKHVTDSLRRSSATSVSDDIDSMLLFAFLFGSDQFYQYIGRLSTATSALVGDSPKISKQ